MANDKAMQTYREADAAGREQLYREACDSLDHYRDCLLERREEHARFISEYNEFFVKLTAALDVHGNTTEEDVVAEIARIRKAADSTTAQHACDNDLLDTIRDRETDNARLRERARTLEGALRAQIAPCDACVGRGDCDERVAIARAALAPQPAAPASVDTKLLAESLLERSAPYPRCYLCDVESSPTGGGHLRYVEHEKQWKWRCADEPSCNERIATRLAHNPAT